MDYLIKINYIDEVYCQIEAVDEVIQLIYKHFTFPIPNWFFIKQKNPYIFGNGKKSLFSISDGFLPIGLIKYLIKFIKLNNFLYDIDEKIIKNNYDFSLTREIFDKRFNEILNNVKEINLINKTGWRTDYQKDAIFNAIKEKKITLNSPTNSGKTIIIYFYIAYLINYLGVKKILMFVPKTTLREETINLFKRLGLNIKILNNPELCKNEDTFLLITTWQKFAPYSLGFGKKKKIKSLSKKKERKNMLEKSIGGIKSVECTILDESHQLKNTSSVIRGISLSLTNSIYRLGCSGTIDKKKELDFFGLVGFWGKFIETVSNKEMREKGISSKIKINIIKIDFENRVKKIIEALSWSIEDKILETNFNPDISIITNIIKKEINNKKNVLLLFNYKLMGFYLEIKKIIEKDINCKVLVVEGDTNLENRKKVKETFNSSHSNLAICSYGTFSTGEDIHGIDVLICVQMMKSYIKVNQSIGRILRVAPNGKDKIKTVYDIFLNTNRQKKHFEERILMYRDKKNNHNFTIFEEKSNLTENVLKNIIMEILSVLEINKNKDKLLYEKT